MQLTLKELQVRILQTGVVKAILLRSEKYRLPVSVENAIASRENGLQGDHHQSHSKKRQVTLIQYEHLQVIAALLGKTALDPALLRRNIVVSGINLFALKDKVITVGDVTLKITGPCHPCSRMEKTLGAGGYAAMRGHGGITAQILEDGAISVNDSVQLVDQ